MYECGCVKPQMTTTTTSFVDGRTESTSQGCLRVNLAISAIRDAEFPMETSQRQDDALGRVLITLIQTKDVANCEASSIR